VKIAEITNSKPHSKLYHGGTNYLAISNGLFIKSPRSNYTDIIDQDQFKIRRIVMRNRPEKSELEELEIRACTPEPVDHSGFNPHTILPHGCSIEAIEKAMSDFLDFLGFVNQQLNTRQTPRLESMLMAANFSSIVGEFMISNIPKYCHSLVRNRHHNGHPDLVSRGYYQDDDVLHGDQGIEIKASRQLSGWQGHNPEACWLMVFVIDCNGRDDSENNERATLVNKRRSFISPRPFRFIKVVGAQLTEADWSFSGRTGTSRRTITSSVIRSGYQKMMNNWIYKDSLFQSKSII
jgi:hypothetical protein